MDLIFLLVIGIAVLIGAHMIARPEYHAKSGTGAFGDAAKIRKLGVLFVVLGVGVFILRSVT